MILRTWFEEVWNKGNEAAIDLLLSPDVQIHNLDSDGEKVTDVLSFKKMFHDFRAAFSEIHVTVEHEVTEGDMAAAYCIITGVHSGDGLRRIPTNHPIYFTGMCMVRIRDGKIIESWNHFDFETMYQQME